MKGCSLFIVLLIVSFSSFAQRTSTVERPKLVIGLVVDQMRWDYLYRYSDLYGNDGFKRLLREGFSCENTMINYLPSYTAPGHACIYTGSVPTIHGIAGNDWREPNSGTKSTYCVADKNAQLVGENGLQAGASMSPRNLLTTTITDELKLATNMRSRVFGVAIKDRGSILPAGHLADGAFWFDDNLGGFYSSSYYAYPLPEWLKTFNSLHLADELAKQPWDTLYPIAKYTQSMKDSTRYERPFMGEKTPEFRHSISGLTGRDKYTALKAMPAGNTLTFSMAKACVNGEKLGKGTETDFLCISLSSTDYMGHQFGPNSVEAEDMYLRLDKEIADFLTYLDGKAGKGNYLLFLTADHGAAHNPQFLTDRKIPAGFFYQKVIDTLKTALKARFQKDGIVDTFMNYQFFLNEQLIVRDTLKRDSIKYFISEFMLKRAEVSYLIDLEHIDRMPLPEPIHTMVVNGYYRPRCGAMEVILNPGWFEGYGSSTTGTTHGTWNPYDAHIPLLWYGWHIPKGETNTLVNMTDISATLAALLHIQAPNGCVGKPITEITDKQAKK